MTIEPKFYMIQMSDNSISQYYKKLVLPSWKDYHIHMYEAVTPEGLHVQQGLDFAHKLSKGSYGVEFSPTEKAVWYSHFNLWKACITMNKPIVVIEHDMKLRKEGLVTKNFREASGVGLGYTYITKRKMDINLPCGCYYLTPYVAKTLVRTIQKDPVKINPDGHIKKFLDTEKENWCVEQIIDKNIGTTIVHNKNNVVE